MIKSADFVSKDNQYKTVFLRHVVGLSHPPSSHSSLRGRLRTRSASAQSLSAVALAKAEASAAPFVCLPIKNH